MQKVADSGGHGEGAWAAIRATGRDFHDRGVDWMPVCPSSGGDEPSGGGEHQWLTSSHDVSHC